ncbi:hypothetical protein KAF25_003272 [Fusarium avenaceum]|uniref:DUF6594 domain-containing protein n=1 Tax=Fusarium avenaceum TaxID=40199 RepID=A0A9P7H1C1_9HYPO|nr:hypothetical protein KAF25_003272 [Fusarium avenaceum]
MNNQAQGRPRASWSSSEGPSLSKATSHQSTVEDYEESTSQSPSEGGTQYPTPPSSASKMEYTPAVQRSVSGSAVTQLTPSDDTAVTKTNGNRGKVPREARNLKVKGARPSSISSSGPGPNSTTHEAFSSSPESSYFKTPLHDRQVAAAPYAPTAVAVANYPQSPLSPVSYANWGPPQTPAGYPPPQEPFAPQQLGLPPINHAYHSGFAYANQRSPALDPAFANQPPLYEPQHPEADEQMPVQNDDLHVEALNGYASIAARLSGQSEPCIQPLYRRFDWLHHRILLYHQDRIGDLEEELIHLDSITTKNGGHMSVSFREEREAKHAIHQERNRVVHEIEMLLRKYRNAISSLEDMQKLPVPKNADIQAYKTFLNQRNVLIEEETRFLGSSDLVVLPRGPRTNSPGSDQTQTQQTSPPLVPLRTLINGFSMSFLCLAVLMMALPDLTTRLVMVVSYGVLVTTVLSTTGHLRRLRQLFEG